MEQEKKTPVETTDPGGDESESGASELERLRNHNKELLSELKKVKSALGSIESAKSKEEEEKAKEQGKYKELSEKKDREIAELKTKIANFQRQQSLTDLAISKGINPKASKFFEAEFDDSGTIVNPDMVIQKFQADWPELVKSQSQDEAGKIAPVDNRKPGTQKTGNKPFTREDIKRMTGTPEWEKNKEEIEKQMAAGLIV